MAKKSPIDTINSLISKKMDNKDKNFKVFKTFGSATECISFGNYLLNAQTSGDLFGGLPNTKSIELAGKSGTGKTFLCLNMVSDAQLKEYHVYYIDTEGSVDDEVLKNFGINKDKITHIRSINTFDALIHFANNLIKSASDIYEDDDFERPKIMLIIDSIGMLNTETALENALKGKYAEDMGKRAKIVRELFRNITLDLSNMAIPLVFTNHTANSLDLFAIDKEVTSSGEGPTFAAHFITLLGKANYLKETNDEKETIKTGVLLRSRSFKNRQVVPMDIKFHLSFKKGMNPYVGLEKYISWDNCGVDFGTIFTQDEFMTKYKKGVATNSKGDELRTDRWVKDGVDYVCVLNENAKTLAVKSTCKNESYDDIFTNKIWTHETLTMLNETTIKPMFKYSGAEDTASEIVSMVKSAIVGEE